MALSTGMRLGPYEILAPIGAGGMGEVYRAKDTRLDRTVAIKVLPSHLSTNPDLKQRFDREARAISNLSDPHICALYDIGHQDDVDYLVMEYLEGQTLTERLTKGALPAEQVLRYGMEIANALDKAHRQGIIHRDLKPGNIMLTKSGAKLLDFGLAKSLQIADAVSSKVSALVTEAKDLTAEGTIVGTFQYMSPEQLEGKQTDSRTDIFAFGTVLYEMATGKRAFTGSSQASLIAAILSSEPAPISTIQPMTPPALDRVVKTCLAKDPDERWQNAHDLANELKWIAEGGSQPGIAAPLSKKRMSLNWIAWAVAALFFCLAMTLAVIHFRTAPQQQPRTVRFSISAPADQTFSGSFAISPDGTNIAFVAIDQTGKSLLWLRPTNSFQARALPGTEGALYPFWSPDGRLIGFFAEGKLKKIEATGGTPQTLCDSPDTRGGAWSSKGVIVFAPSSNSGLYRVSESGGAVTPATSVDPSKLEVSHRWPSFLPDGNHFLFLFLTGKEERQGIYLGSLDSNVIRRLLPEVSRVVYARGTLLFLHEGGLVGQSFDPTSAQLKSDLFPVAQQIWSDPSSVTGLSAFSVSENGILAYRTGGPSISQFTWFDRNGNRLGTVGLPGTYAEPWFSPDQNRVSFTIYDPRTVLGDIWLMELPNGTISRFTFDPADDASSIWSPDGRTIIFTSTRGGPYEVFHKVATGAGKETPLFNVKGAVCFPDDWSLDGRFILFETNNPKTRFDLWVYSIPDRKQVPFLVTQFNEAHSQFSPDGHWVAYVSDESGRQEVYVQSFPSSAGGKWQISTRGGDGPAWRRDGKELFYLASDSKLMAVDVREDSSVFRPGVPRALFEAVPYNGITGNRNFYLVSSDGQRFLILKPLQEPSASTISVVLNWTADLKK